LFDKIFDGIIYKPWLKKEGRRELQPVFTNHPNAKLSLLAVVE
jgi:hypothetical protein